MTVTVHLKPSGETERFKDARNGAYGWHEFRPDHDGSGYLHVVRVSHAVVVDGLGSRPWQWSAVGEEVVAEYPSDQVIKYDYQPGLPPRLKPWSEVPRRGLIRKRPVLPDDPVATDS